MNHCSKQHLLVLSLLTIFYQASGNNLHERDLFLSCPNYGPHVSDISRYHLDQARNSQNIIPVAVIGGGAAGLSAAIYTERGGFKTVVFTGTHRGGQLVESGLVENIPGITRQPGKEIMKNLESHAESFGVALFSATIESVDFTQWPFKLTTSDQEFHALAVIIATGSTAKMLGIPGEAQYLGIGVSTCALCDAAFYNKSEDVVVVGGGDSSVEQALLLAPHVRSVTILNRSGAMRSASRVRDRLGAYKNSIFVRMFAKVNEICGDGQKLTHIIVEDAQTHEQSRMDIAGLFLAIGHTPNTRIFTSQLALDERDYIILNGRTQRTSVPGVFACGENSDYLYRQAIVAEGDGAKAGIDAVAFLHELGVTPDFQQSLKIFNVPLAKEDL